MDEKGSVEGVRRYNPSYERKSVIPPPKVIRMR